MSQIWTLRQLLSLIYVCLKFLASMLFSSNSPYLSRLNFGKLRKNEIAAISSKMTFFTFRKKRCARNWPYFNISRFQRNLFFKVDPPYGLKYLLDNCFFTVGNIVMKQDIGIPMGINPAPFWANLFLYTLRENLHEDSCSRR